MSYLKKQIQSFGFAFSGLWQGVKNEANLKLEFIIALLVITAGFYFSISKMEAFVVGACITLVISLELINTAIEKLCDLYSIEQNPKIKYIKDVSAAAVLVAAIFAAIMGTILFWPYIFSGSGIFLELKNF